MDQVLNQQIAINASQEKTQPKKPKKSSNDNIPNLLEYTTIKRVTRQSAALSRDKTPVAIEPPQKRDKSKKSKLKNETDCTLKSAVASTVTPAVK